ncbi:MAG: ABC transporter ATP-binding protein [Acidimicrobiia bacterium]|nr:MAG: ABC transporter ATP-binding protein [Acidimicrobiia bacterium]
MPSISLVDVAKRYGKTTALDGLTVDFPSGSVVGFLGPNGAGKTTTFRCILGLTRPDRGTVQVLGYDVARHLVEVTRRVAAVLEDPGLYDTHSGVANMLIAADTLGEGHDRIEELLELVDLTAAAGRRVKGYSKGMRQRLALATALLSDPEILLLDEPLDGLDPAGQRAMKTKLVALARSGKTVVVSSHDLADIEQLADHVVMIHRGRLVAQGPLSEVVGPARSLVVEVDRPSEAAEALRAAGFGVELADGRLVVDTEDGTRVNRVLSEAGFHPSALTPRRPGLEEVFLRLTGEGT